MIFKAPGLFYVPSDNIALDTHFQQLLDEIIFFSANLDKLLANENDIIRSVKSAPMDSQLQEGENLNNFVSMILKVTRDIIEQQNQLQIKLSGFESLLRSPLYNPPKEQKSRFLSKLNPVNLAYTTASGVSNVSKTLWSYVPSIPIWSKGKSTQDITNQGLPDTGAPAFTNPKNAKALLDIQNEYINLLERGDLPNPLRVDITPMHERDDFDYFDELVGRLTFYRNRIRNLQDTVMKDYLANDQSLYSLPASHSHEGLITLASQTYYPTKQQQPKRAVSQGADYDTQEANNPELSYRFVI